LDRFVAQDNINRFRDQLRLETDPTKRSILQKLLVEEEDKLAVDFALLEDVAQEITNCLRRIDRLRALVETLERCGRDVTTAKALLSAITESLVLHQDYRQRLATRLDQTPSYRETRGVRPKKLSTFSASRFSREQRRALEMLARAPRGLTEHFLLAHGLSAEMLSSLVLTKLATVLTEPMMEYRGATFTVERIHITDAGRMSLKG
jgi:hypothetical protein